MDEMAKKMKIQKSAISYHLALLKDNDMVCVKKRSRFAFYALSQSGKKAILAFGDIQSNFRIFS